MRANSEAFPSRRRRWLPVLFLGVGALIAPARLSRAQLPPPAPYYYYLRPIPELQQLVAPIALYPDALLAQVLAASTYPDDVIAAARWEDAGNNPQGIDAQPWDSSVKGVARYPSVLHYLASNIAWTNDLGASFLNQQGDVMAAVQDMRGQALAAGTLVSTAQQTVINENGYIQIIPTNPQYIYVPVYDPRVVYAPPPPIPGQPYPVYITFGLGVVVGDWLDFDLDWHDRALYYGRWGANRPWWHDRDRAGVYHYLEDRPGVYQPGRFRDTGGRPIVVEANHWNHDDRRPAPRPPERPPVGRPERGYPQRGDVTNDRPAEAPRGADVSRESERGRTSREQASQPQARPAPQPQARPAPQPQARPAPQAPARAAPEPAPRAPEPAPAPRSAEPVRQAPPEPARQAPEPARAAPRQSTPAPEARPSAPTRGGAVGGYQNHEAASQSAARGAASRGGRH